MNVKDFDRHTSRKKQEIQNMGSEWVPGKSLERNASSKWQELRTGQKHSYASFEVSLQLMSSTLISWHVSLSHQHNHYGSISCPILLAPLNVTFTIPLWDMAIVKIFLKDLSQKNTSFIVDWFVQILLVRWCHIPRRWKKVIMISVTHIQNTELQSSKSCDPEYFWWLMSRLPGQSVTYFSYVSCHLNCTVISVNMPTPCM